MPWWLLKVADGLFLEVCHLVHNCPKNLLYYRSKELHLLPTPNHMCRLRKLRVKFLSLFRCSQAVLLLTVPDIPQASGRFFPEYSARAQDQSHQPQFHPRTTNYQLQFLPSVLFFVFLQIPILMYTPFLFFLLMSSKYFRRQACFCSIDTASVRPHTRLATCLWRTAIRDSNTSSFI